MSILTQGTHIFALMPTAADPAKLEVLHIQKATAFNPGGSPAEQIEDTGLEDLKRFYQPGLRTPGQAAMTLNADPRYRSHVRLHEVSNANPPPTLRWAVGWADGIDLPTVGTGAAAGDLVLPTTRTWFAFSGYVSDFPFDFTLNAIVTTNVTIQRSGGSLWKRKVVA